MADDRGRHHAPEGIPMTTAASEPAAQPAPAPYDIAVIGAGVVGSAIARELAGYQLSVVCVEARSDVGDGTSKANTAILHTGFDAKPGTLESRLVHRGHELLGDYATRTGIPVERTGARLVAWTQEELDALPRLQARAQQNGYHDTEIIDAGQVYRELPHLGPGALGALTVPDESIICTWTATLALATDARLRGTDLQLNSLVESADVGEETTTLHTTSGDIQARYVINAAGLGCDTVDQLFGYDRFTVTPRRGELLVFDKQARPLTDKIVLPVPSQLGKGVLVSPTIYGNIMLGPTAEDLPDKTATGTSENGFEFLLSKGERIIPTLLNEEVTASYAGLRAAINHGDYLIEADPGQRYVVVGGIRSTGLTSSMAIAEHVRDLLADGGLKLIPRAELPGPPRMPNIGESFTRPYQDEARISADPAYGRIVCFCERVTAGEIRDAYRSAIPPCDLNGLRRRTRAMNGRCQGFYCGAEILALAGSRGDLTPLGLAAQETR
jgi:glycerol-3-phosphate dehydrogenase